MTTVPDVLAFADRKTDGAFEVTDPSGATIARIRTSAWTGSSFEAFHPGGDLMCRGRRRSIFSGWWDAQDPVGRALVSMKSSFAGRRRQVELAGGRSLTVEGRWLGRDWAMRDETGRDVLTSVPTTGAWSFRPDAWVVRSHDGSLDLATLVAVVELNRLMVKAARSSTAATS